MNTSHIVMQRIVKLGLIMMMGGSMSACSDSWKEEVLLHDGQKIIISRSQTYGGQHEFGQPSPIKEHTISFTPPNSNKSITWTSEYGEDSGAELFGDATPAYAAGTTNPSTGSARTADGFAALAQEDTNHDGVVNNLDVNWNNLRVWQDLNQDGISQANELTTLAAAGIESFNVARTAHSQMLPSGNQMADLGTFTRNDGTTGNTGAPQGMADINLVIDTFHRTFTDTIPTTATTQNLPDMQGSGKVRDLQQAASLQTTAGQALSFGQQVYDPATHTYKWDPKIIRANFWGAQLTPLDQAYTALRESVYQALLPQTRLKPYLDAITYTVDAKGLHLDFSAVQTAFQTQATSNPNKAVADLIEFNRYGKDTFAGTTWQTERWSQLGEMLNCTTITPAIQKTLADFNIGMDGHPEQIIKAGQDQVLFASDAGSTLNSGNYNAVLVGRAGDDTLNGGWGNDLLMGGAGKRWRQVAVNDVAHEEVERRVA